jgi:branched-chain amino acid transport system substrate-binding protein
VTYTLALASVDSACDAGRAITAANELLAQGAAVVVGHTCSGVSMNAQAIYQAQGVPMISPSSTLVQLTEQGVTTTFRTCVKDDASAKRLATHVHTTGEAQTAALVAWEGHEWIMEAFSTTFTALGGSLTSVQTVTTTESFTPLLAAIQAQGSDLVFYADLSTDNAGLFTRVADAHSLPKVGWDPVYGGPETLDPYADAAGAAAEGDTVGLSGRQPQDMAGYSGFSADYQAAGFANHGASPGTFGPFAYDAAQIAIAAMESAGSVDPAAIRDAIAATDDHSGVVGVYDRFDAQGDVVPQWAWVMRYSGGEWQRVYDHGVYLPLLLRSSS